MKENPCYTCGIDTIEIATTTLITDKCAYLSNDSSCNTFESEGVRFFKYRINPDKKAEKNLYSLSEYKSTIKDIFDELKLENLEIRRIDFRFDDYSSEYRDLFKLNQLLFLLLSIRLSINNDYSSYGIKSPEMKTLRIQNSRIEAEFYNKKKQEPNGNIKCRLELRSKGLKYILEHIPDETIIEKIELMKWIDNLNAISELKKEDYDKIIEGLNNEIIKCYKSDVDHNEYTKTDYNSMIQRYNKYIYTRRQLVDLYRRLGYCSAESMASKYKGRHTGIEFFSIYEIRKYIKHIFASARTFIMT